MRAHYNELFSSSLEDQETKRERLLALGTSCFADHENGVHSWIHLPLHTLLDTGMKMQRCKAPGADGLVYEMFLLLDWDTVGTLRVSFERRFNCVYGFVEAIPEWLSVAVCTVPKDRNAHSCEKLRPLSHLSALNKWYVYGLRHLRGLPPCLSFYLRLVRLSCWPSMHGNQ